MATIKLYDPRDPVVAGREAFQALLDGQNEILVDRDGLTHAFYEATAHLADRFAHLADVLAGAVRSDDTVVAAEATIVREQAAEAQRLAHLLLGVIWEASPGISAAVDGTAAR